MLQITNVRDQYTAYIHYEDVKYIKFYPETLLLMLHLGTAWENVYIDCAEHATVIIDTWKKRRKSNEPI